MAVVSQDRLHCMTNRGNTEIFYSFKTIYNFLTYLLLFLSLFPHRDADNFHAMYLREGGGGPGGVGRGAHYLCRSYQKSRCNPSTSRCPRSGVIIMIILYITIVLVTQSV